MSDADVIAGLTRALELAARSAAEAEVALTSVSFDRAGGAELSGEVSYDTVIDRRTRSLVFLHGNARTEDRIALTATAVFRIAG